VKRKAKTIDEKPPWQERLGGFSALQLNAPRYRYQTQRRA